MIMKYLVLLAISSAAFSVCRASKCPDCLENSTDMASLHVSAVKWHILSKLGLSAAPNVTGRRLPKIPPLLSILESRDLQPVQRLSLEDDYHAKTQRMIVFPTRDSPFLVGKSPSWWFFDFTRKKSRLKVARAAIWIYLKNSSSATGKDDLYFNIKIYQGIYPLHINNTPAKLLTLSRQFTRNESGWRSFKLKRVVKGWVQESQKNLGIFVELVGAEPGRMVLPGQDPNLQPFLVLHTQDSGDKWRAKRSAGVDCNDPNIPSSGTCCRHPLTINFDLIGWQFVIAPKTYEAFYCTGECTGMAYSLHKYYHTHFVGKEKKRRGEKNTFCCSPSKVSPLTMLYLLNDKIMYEKVPGMRIDTCGCS